MGEKMLCGYEPRTSKMALPTAECWGGGARGSLCWVCLTHHFTEKLCFLFQRISAAIKEDLPALAPSLGTAALQPRS